MRVIDNQINFKVNNWKIQGKYFTKWKDESRIFSIGKYLLKMKLECYSSAGEDVEKGEHFLHCWWECRLVQPLWKAVWWYLKKNTNGSAFWPSDPTFGNISKGTWNTNSKEHEHPCVHCSVIYNHQDMEAAQVSISRWADETTGTFTQWNTTQPQKRRKFYPLQQYG